VVGLVGYITAKAAAILAAIVRAGHKLSKSCLLTALFELQSKGEKMFKKTKQIFIKIDDRREKIEDFIANEILSKVDECQNIDILEEKAIIAAITAANAYAATYGVPSIPDDIKEKIAKASVKVLGKANKKLQTQLKKKSKAYKKRHTEEEK